MITFVAFCKGQAILSVNAAARKKERGWRKETHDDHGRAVLTRWDERDTASDDVARVVLLRRPVDARRLRRGDDEEVGRERDWAAWRDREKSATAR